MKQIQWPTAIVLVAFFVAISVAYLAGPSLGVPEDSHAKLVGGLGILGIAIANYMQPVFTKILTKDSDEDGLPDIVDSTPNPKD